MQFLKQKSYCRGKGRDVSTNTIVNHQVLTILYLIIHLHLSNTYAHCLVKAIIILPRFFFFFLIITTFFFF